MSKVIGIDLGTTNSCVAVMEGGKPKVIHSAEGENTVPSAVDVDKGVVGRGAKRQQVVNPKSTITSVKRLMGRKLSDKDIQKELGYLAYDVVEGQNGMAVVSVNGKTYTPQEISARVLQKLKADAEGYLGQKVTQAVITVPAYFDDSQRQATKQAGEIAGLEVLRIINEPTAAVLAYGLEKNMNAKVAVYDLGGGTFDISILEIESKQSEDDRNVYQVLSTNGDTHLGGDDFDKALVDYLVSEFKSESGIDISADKQAMQRIRDAAEKAKIELSSRADTEINIPYLTADATGPKHLVLSLSRSKFESLVSGLIARTFESVKKAMDDAGLKVSDINEVILVGGMSRMPKVTEEVKSFFGREPHKGVNPDEVVALGAAIQGGVLSGDAKDVLLLDVTPLTLGLETLGSVSTPLIERNTTVPTSRSQVFSTAADNQTQVEINVLQGERPMAADNKSLGRFVLDGIPPAPRGVPQVEVTFDIDTNGILHVSAKDKTSGKEQKITITGSTGLSKEEIEKMVAEAKLNEAADLKKKEMIEVKNMAESILFTAEKALKDAEGKVSDEVKSEVEAKMESLRDALKGEDTEAINKAAESLGEAMQKIGPAMSQDSSSENSGSEDSGDSSTPKDAAEGEVVEE